MASKAERYQVPALKFILDILLTWEYVVYVLCLAPFTFEQTSLAHISGFTEHAAPELFPLRIMIEGVKLLLHATLCLHRRYGFLSHRSNIACED